MKLKNLILLVDKSDPQEPCYQELSDELGLDSFYLNSDIYNESSLVYYPLMKWRCTDTFVGTNLYFLKGEFVGQCQKDLPRTEKCVLIAVPEKDLE